MPGPSGSEFGFDLALDLPWLLVGAPASDYPEDSGAALFYELVDDEWIRRQVVTDLRPEEGRRFGEGVAMDGEWAVITSAYDNVLFYRLEGGRWVHTQTILNRNPSSRNPALRGDLLVTLVDSPPGTLFSAFRLIDGQWVREADVPRPSDSVGWLWSIISSDEVAVSVMTANQRGLVLLIYRRVNGQWTLVQQVEPAPGMPDEVVSRLSIAFDEQSGRLIVGTVRTPYFNGLSSFATFLRGHDGVWRAEYTENDPRDRREYGETYAYAVALVGEQAFVSAPQIAPSKEYYLDPGPFFQYDLSPDCGGGCPPDLDGSGEVDGNDFLTFLALFFAADSRADFNADGVVDGADFLGFLAAFFEGC